MTAGEEVPALVLEVGSYCTKAGYTGEDGPRAVFHSKVGVISPPSSSSSSNAAVDGDVEMADASTKTFFGESADMWRENMEILQPLDQRTGLGMLMITNRL